MTGIDTSFYSTQPAQVNPLQMLGEAQGIANAAQQNRLLQLAQQKEQQDIESGGLDLAAKKAYADAIRRHTGPDGRVDTAGVQADLGEAGAVNAYDMLLKANQINAPTPYMGTDANGNPQQKYMGAQEMGLKLNSRINPPEITPQQRQSIDQLHGRLDAYDGAIDGLLNNPNHTMTDVVNTTTDLMGNGHLNQEEGAGILGEMPSDPAQRQQWLLAKKQELAQHRANLNAISPRQPETGSNAVDNDIAAGPPLGYEQRQEQAGDRRQQIMSAATAATKAAPAIQKVLALSQEGVKTGPTQEWKNKVRSFLADQGLAAEGDDASLFQEFQKYTNQLAQSGGMPGSDERLQALQHANPNDKMLPKAVQDVAKFLLAQNTGATAKQKAMLTAIGNSNNPAAEEAFELAWNQYYDPRAIQLTQMDSKERQEFLRQQKDAPDLIEKYKMLKQMGAFGQ